MKQDEIRMADDDRLVALLREELKPLESLVRPSMLDSIARTQARILWLEGIVHKQDAE